MKSVVFATLGLLSGLSVGLAAGPRQSDFALGALTVPATSLPSGCALTGSSPIAFTLPGETDSTTPAPMRRSDPQFPTNPWFGTEPELVRAVHMSIAPPVRSVLPDIPPQLMEARPDWKDSSADIREAYRASYTSLHGNRVDVFAATFTDAKSIPDEPLSRILDGRGETGRFVRGATLIRTASREISDCYKAINRHIRTLM